MSVRTGPALVLVDPRNGRVMSHWPITGARHAVATIRPSDHRSTSHPLGNRMWLTSYDEGRVYGVDVTPERG